MTISLFSLTAETAQLKHLMEHALKISNAEQAWQNRR